MLRYKAIQRILQRATSSSGTRFFSSSPFPDQVVKAPWARAALAAFTVTSAGLGYTVLTSSSTTESSNNGGAAQCHGPTVVIPTDLPEFDKEEVSTHKTKDSRVWVTYKDGVYDVTEWVDQHPGGAARLMMAAGGAIDPYWAMYAQHNTEQVRNILEGYRIGRLKGGAPPVHNPYSNEPQDRLAALEVRSKQPMNAETPLELLADALITPNELFYIRNHLPVPEIDMETYKLQIGGEGLRAVSLSLEDLKTKFKKHSVTAAVQCTGNRRADLMREAGAKPIKGLSWEGAAIGNAVWSGVLLRDVLQMAGLDQEDPAVAHIQFEGLDHDATGGSYGASIPISKAMDPRGDVLVAYEMNGEPLNRDHGAPVRVLVPGVAGCRSVKWLGKIIASGEESRSFWQREDYKSFSPSVDWDTVDWDSAPAIQNMPVTSQICSPAHGAAVDVVGGGSVTVKGYAWSGGGNGIIRVDVSSDNGQNWTTAELKKVAGQEVGRGWAWTLWEAEVPVSKRVKCGEAVTIVAKAVDESYNTQPERADAIWNLRGVCCNTWPKVTVTVEE